MINQTNVDDIYLRNAIMSVIHYLNKNLYIEQVENELIKQYNIPVFFNKAQDSQFMRDYFTQYGDNCNVIEFADGDYDMEPFGILNLESFVINTSKITSKFRLTPALYDLIASVFKEAISCAKSVID